VKQKASNLFRCNSSRVLPTWPIQIFKEFSWSWLRLARLH